MQDRAVRTRNCVLRAAGEVFAESGFRGANLADILARAGVTKGALYFHFRSKEELAVAVIEREEEIAEEIAAQELARGGDPLQALIVLVDRWARAISTDPVVRGGVRLIIEQGTYERPMPNPYGRWAKRVTDLLQRAAEQGELRAGVDCGSAAEFVVAAFTGIQLVSQAASGHADLQKRLQAMWHVVLNGLIPEGRKIIFIAEPSP